MANDEPTGDNAPETTPIVLIDTHMIQHFLSKEVGKELEELLAQLENIGAKLAVSEVVIYEALKAIIFNKDKFNKVDKFFEKYLTRYPVNEEVLVDAARVHEIYGYNEKTRASRQSISTEDIIIATTAMRMGVHLITCDVNDYPAPFFREINRQYIPYVVKNRKKHIVVYLLQPDSDIITKAIDELENPTLKVRI